MSLFIEMCENSQQTGLKQTELEKSTLSLEDSPARMLAARVNELVSIIAKGKLPDPVCGQSMPVSLARLSHDGLWQKMFGDSCQSLLWTDELGGDSEPFSETWPTYGILFLGDAGVQQKSALLTGEIEFLLLPSPRVNDAEKRGAIANDPRNGLPATVQHWPTPRVGDVSGGDRSKWAAEGKWQLGLREAVKMANWPTPKVPSGGGQVQRNTAGGGIRKLEDAISADVGYNTGQLNADWCECLMGFPIGFTDIDCDNPQEWPGWPMGLGAKLWRTAEAHDNCERQFARNSRGEPKLSAQAQIMPHGQYLYEPPRVITGQKNRAKRLRCLGNAVVSQQAAPIFFAIMEVENERNSVK